MPYKAIFSSVEIPDEVGSDEAGDAGDEEFVFKVFAHSFTILAEMVIGDR